MKKEETEDLERLVAESEVQVPEDLERLVAESEMKVPEDLERMMAESEVQVPEDLERMMAESEVQVPEHLERKMEAFVDALDGQSHTRLSPRFRTGIRMAGAAAVLALVIGLGHVYLKKSSEDVQLKDTFSNPSEAYAEVEKVLGIISEKTASATEIACSGINRTEQILEEQLTIFK